MGGEGWGTGVGQKKYEIYIVLWPKTTHRTSATNLGTITSLQTSEDTRQIPRRAGAGVCEEESSFVFSARAPGWVGKRKKSEVRERDTHIMYCKNVGFFGSTITRIYDENIKKTIRTRIMKCLAFFLSWLLG